MSLACRSVTVGTISASVSASGTIAAPQSDTLAWETTGIIAAINVSVGDVVEADAVLAELDPESLSASIVQAEADLLVSQATLENVLDGPSDDEIAAARLAVIVAQETVTDTQRSLYGVLNPNVAYYQEQYIRAQEDVAPGHAGGQPGACGGVAVRVKKEEGGETLLPPPHYGGVTSRSARLVKPTVIGPPLRSRT